MNILRRGRDFLRRIGGGIRRGLRRGRDILRRRIMRRATGGRLGGGGH